MFDSFKYHENNSQLVNWYSDLVHFSEPRCKAVRKEMCIVNFLPSLIIYIFHIKYRNEFSLQMQDLYRNVCEAFPISI